MRTRTRSSTWHGIWALTLTAVLAIGLTACTDEADDGPDDAPTPSSVTIQQPHTPAIDVPELQPLIGGLCLEIDRADLNDPPANYGDANLVTGPDSDGSPSYQVPMCSGSTTWTDWDELETDVNAAGGSFDSSQFRLLDTISAQGTSDPSAFPFSDERVGSANVLGKQDIVQGAIAANPDWVYVGIWRQSTNGSSSYFWVFTKAQPHIHPANENRLLYDITEGDILFAGDFNPATNKVNIFEVFTAKPGVNLTNVPAGDVATPENATIWQPYMGQVVGALNTTPMDPGTLYDITANIPKQNLTKSGDWTAGAFAEGAVPLTVFTGGALCGDVFHGTVITRPSRSRTSDLKDLLGPFILNLGTIEPRPDLQADCDGNLLFSADPIIGETSVNQPVCDWEITCDGQTVYQASNDCSQASVNVATNAAASCQATVTASSNDPLFFGCQATDVDDETVYPPLTAIAQTTPYCEDPAMAGYVSSFDYASSVSGGSGQYTLAWSFTNEAGGAAPSPTSATNASGSVLVSEVSATTKYRAALMVTDDMQTDGDGGAACTAPASDLNIPLAPLSANLSLATANEICAVNLGTFETLSDVRQYNAAVSGGSGLYDIDWTPDSFCSDKASTSSTTDSCTIDPDDGTQLCGELSIYATFDSLALGDGLDGIRAVCDPATTNTGSYTKQLTVNGGIDP